MDDKTINSVFENLKGHFDIDEPAKDHELRFTAKLNGRVLKDSNKFRLNTIWKPLLAIAACIVIFFGVYGTSNLTTADGLASVSPELSEARDFFTATINEELKKLDAERSPLTENIIYEAERQLKNLEQDYEVLKNDLKESGNDKRVIYAMIANFQNRIEILENILDQIDDLKETQNDTEITL